MKKTAIVILYTFHPLVLTTYLTGTLFLCIPRYLMLPLSSAPTFIGLISIITLFFPLINIFIFKVFGIGGDYKFRNDHDISIAIGMINIIYMVVAWMFIFKVNIGFGNLMAIITVVSIAGTSLWLLARVAIQAVAMGGFFGIVTAIEVVVEGLNLLWPIFGLGIIVGAVLSSILYLNKNSLKQVMLGVLVGYAIGFLGILF